MIMGVYQLLAKINTYLKNVIKYIIIYIESEGDSNE
nr:MAG TPA: hypothetical protein [Caudoviricetes sp.]